MSNNKNPIIPKIIFAGTSSLAQKVLEDLVKNKYEIIASITKPDKKAGRKQEIAFNPVKDFCQKNNIPVLQPHKLDDDFIKSIKRLQPDLIVVAAYGKILPQKFLDIPKFGSINVHASLLPKLRGASPIQNAIMLGYKKTGVTIMLMDAGIDTGDILTQYEVDIDPDDTTAKLSEKLARFGSELLIKTIPLWTEKKIEPRKQNNLHATLCQLIEKNDGRILWTQTAQEVYNRYRAFHSWPGIFCFWEENEKGTIRRIKLTDISIHENTPEKHHLGEIFSYNNAVCIQSSDGVVSVNKIQIEGKPEMEISAFINGYPKFIGSILK